MTLQLRMVLKVYLKTTNRTKQVRICNRECIWPAMPRVLSDSLQEKKSANPYSVVYTLCLLYLPTI